MDGVIQGKITIIIPAYNEEKTIRKVAKTALEVKKRNDRVHEIIIVNDGCTDSSADQLKDLPVRVVTHKKNKGYTAALSTGIRQTKTEFVSVIDADWRNIRPESIEKIIIPLLDGEADLVKGSFNRARGRTTKFAVKPMMNILYPEYNFEQPLSGQFAGRKEFLQSVDIPNSWGIAIGILLEAIQQGLRVKEVFIGELVHKARSDEDIAEMAQEVMETMIRKAGLIQHKYKLIVFTLDETLIKRASLLSIYDKLGLRKEVEDLYGEIDQGTITFAEFANQFALLLKGKGTCEIENVVDSIPLTRYAKEVVNALKRRKYQVAIISSNFSPIVHPIAKKLGIEVVDCIYLIQKNGKLTGEISQPSRERWINASHDITFDKAYCRLLKLGKVKPLETIMIGNSRKSIPLQKAAGLSVAYRPKDKDLKECVDKTINLLAEILVLVE